MLKSGRLASSLILFLLGFTDLAARRETWLIGEFENYKIYSNANQGYTERIVEELRGVREVLAEAFPKYVNPNPQKLRIFVCRNQATVSKFSEIYNGKPKKIGGLFSRDYEGPFIVVNAGGEFDATKQVVYHEYVHFLTHSRNRRMPSWLNEGIAETFSTIQFSKNKVRLGIVDQQNLEILKKRILIPLERLFKVSRSSPEYNSNQHGRTIFYAQSWALVHYLLFGDSDISREKANELMETAIQTPWLTEKEFERIMGFDFREMERRLRRHISIGRHKVLTTENPGNRNSIEIAFRKAEEGEIDLIYGSLLLSTRGPDEALQYLINAYKALPNSPEAAAFRGYLSIRRRQWDFAAKHLEEAVEKGAETSSPHLYYALARIKLTNPANKIRRYNFNQDETEKLLASLMKARELGESRRELYHRIGEVWIGSTLKPSPGAFQMLMEGDKLYPDDTQIGFYRAILYFNSKQYEKASELIEHFLSKDLDRLSKDNFLGLKRGLEEELNE